MPLKICSLLLLLMPFWLQSQTFKSWRLYIDDNMAVDSKNDSIRTVQVHNNADVNLKFVFAKGDTAFKSRVIVMDDQRRGIDDRSITEKGCEATFNAQSLCLDSRGENVTFYIVNIPADPAKAALVRVAPHPFCKLQWLK
jgi:hypothetical protein